MKKIMILLITVVLSMVGLFSCGSEKAVTGYDSITFNGKTLSFPCKVEEVLDVLGNVKINEENLARTVAPNETSFCSIFETNNTSFGVMNMSDSIATVKDCYLVLVSTSVSLAKQTYDVTYPGGIEYGKAFDREKAFEMLGEDTQPTEEAVVYSEAWQDMTIKIDGVEYTYPYSLELLTENGFYIDAELGKELSDYKEELQPGEKTGVCLNHDVYDNGVSYEDKLAGRDKRGCMTLTFKNAGDAVAKTTDCKIMIMRIENSYAFDIVDNYIPFELADGIHTGSAVEEIKAVWGEPDRSYGDTPTCNMIYDRNQVLMELNILADGGLYEVKYTSFK